MVFAAVLHHRAFSANEVGEHDDDDPLLPTIAVQRVFDSHDVVDDVRDALNRRFGTDITGLDRGPIEMRDRPTGKTERETRGDEDSGGEELGARSGESASSDFDLRELEELEQELDEYYGTGT